MPVRGQKVTTLLYLEPEQYEAMGKLAARLGTTKQALYREGVELVLAKHRRARAKRSTK